MGKFVVLCSIAVLSLACVPLKQYQEEVNRNAELKEEVAYLTGENDAQKVKLTELKALTDRQEKEVNALLQDTTRLSRQLQNLRFKYSDLSEQYNEALSRVGQNATSESDKDLLAYLQKLQEDLLRREDALLKTENELNAKKRALELAQSDLSASAKQMSDQQKRLLELENTLKQKDKALQQLKASIANALTGFSNDELKVYQKDGKIYVSLEEKLLFGSGSYVVSEKGSGAIRKIAGVLSSTQGFDIVVEGHTDKIPYKSGVLLDNWDLSVKRATAVVRLLLSDKQLNPNRVTAAGRAEHVPVESGSDAASLQANRRIEIILIPSLNDVMELLEGA